MSGRFCAAWDAGSRVQRFDCALEVPEFWVKEMELRVWGSRLKNWGLGFGEELGLRIWGAIGA